MNSPAQSIQTNGLEIPEDPNPISAYEVKEAIAKLDVLIKAAHPVMPVMLKKIHDQLRADPEVITAISEEEIGIIVTGLKRKMNQELIATPAKKESTAKLKAKANDVSLF